ncbi:MAG: hypothetical protein P8L18_02585 [Verrucomicrobiota bacterium]|nr:hypothetical protein [Verrucomicrobiota bacterium]
MVSLPFLTDVPTLDRVILSIIIPILFWVWKKPNPPEGWVAAVAVEADVVAVEEKAAEGTSPTHA